MIKDLLVPFATLVVCSLLILLAIPASAVEEWRESELNGGWQIWIEAADFDSRDEAEVIKLGEEVKDLKDKAPEPLLAKDIVIAPGPEKTGFNEYEFQSSESGSAFVYCRIMDYRGDGQSWWIALNIDAPDVLDDASYAKTSTSGAWVWKQANLPWKLEKGTNTLRIVPREANAGVEILMDVICISTVAFAPINDNFIEASIKGGGGAVSPEGNLAVTWGAIKSNP